MPGNKGPANTKKFGGKVYHLNDYGFPTLKKAQGEAARRRAKTGRNYRAAKSGHTFAIYVKP